jgi:protein-disulfide isomerase
VLAVLALGIAGPWIAKPSELHFADAARAAADVPLDEFEQRIRSYLLSHPEVIAEALNRLQTKQDEQDAAAAKSVLKAHIADVFQDPDSPVGGNPNGNVTVVEFFDYNCPYCRAMAPLMEKVEAADPQLRIVYKEFPILSPGSVFAAKAALAANKQGKYVAFHRALYQIRGQVDERKVLEVRGHRRPRRRADESRHAGCRNRGHAGQQQQVGASASHHRNAGFCCRRRSADRRDRFQGSPGSDQQGTGGSAEHQVSDFYDVQSQQTGEKGLHHDDEHHDNASRDIHASAWQRRRHRRSTSPGASRRR